MPHFSQVLYLLQPLAMIVPVVACQVWTGRSGMGPGGTAFCGQDASASSSPGLSSVHFPQAICLSRQLLHISPGHSSCPVRTSAFFLLSDYNTDLLLLFLVHTSYLLPSLLKMEALPLSGLQWGPLHCPARKKLASLGECQCF